MGEWFSGSVKFYKKDKRFGYIATDDGREIFYTFKGGRGFIQLDGTDEVAWATSRVTRDPKERDRVVFEVSADPGTGKPRAKPWGFEADMLEIKQRIAERHAA